MMKTNLALLGKSFKFLAKSQRRVFASLPLFTFLLCAVSLAATQEGKQIAKPEVKPNPPTSSTTNEPARVQKIVEQGVAVEFTVNPVEVKDKSSLPKEGEDAAVRFKVTDTTTGTPVTGLNLSAWMSLQQIGATTGLQECKEKIKSFMQGSLRARPDVDLNAYYVLALNKEASISVIDPLLGFGGSKLLTLVLLKSPGADWVLSGDKSRLYVTMPLINQVAVVDTATWKVLTNIEVGIKPTRLAVQPDEKYLWVANDGLGEEASGVTVIDTATLKVARQISTGGGHHEIGLSVDSRFVFISNKGAGTLSVIDVLKLAKIKDIEIGPGLSSLALSPLSKAVYVANEADGTIAVIDGQSHQVLTRMALKPGLGALRFAPGGRYGFIVNSKENMVTSFDASTNRLLQSVVVGKTPDQIAFSDAFAYIHSAGTEEVSLIRLSTVGKQLDVTKFPGGQNAPAMAAGHDSAAGNWIVPTSEGNTMLVANPADKMIYYYSEGMAAPMGNFQNYKREPRSIMVVDRNLRETTPGTYTTTVKLPKSGNYDVAFLADSPRITHCFEAQAEPNPAIKRERSVTLRVEYLTKERTLLVNKSFPLRFKLTDTMTNQSKDNLKDVRVLTFLASGTWQKREFARPVGDGSYEINLNVPQAGVYLIFVESPSLRVSYRELPYLTLRATNTPAASTPAVSSMVEAKQQ